jgi:protease PrsW
MTSLHHWFVNPDRNVSLLLIPLGLTSILIGLGLLIATTAIYIFGRNRIRTSADGFSSAPEPG